MGSRRRSRELALQSLYLIDTCKINIEDTLHFLAKEFDDDRSSDFSEGFANLKSNSFYLIGNRYRVKLEFKIIENLDTNDKKQKKKIELFKFNIEGPTVVYSDSAPYVERSGDRWGDTWTFDDRQYNYSFRLRSSNSDLRKLSLTPTWSILSEALANQEIGELDPSRYRRIIN